MIHEFDFITWLLGTPKNVTASGVNNREGECHVSAHLSYDDAIVEVQASSMMPKSHSFSVGYEAMFENGTIEFFENGYEDHVEIGLKLFTDEGMKTIELSDRNCYEESVKHVVEFCQRDEPSLLSIDKAIISLDVALRIRDML